MKAIGRKIEFATLPDGRVAVMEGVSVSVLKVEDREFIDMMAELIKKQYPSAWKALCLNYKGSEFNPGYFKFKCVCRFISCNMGKMDTLKYDVEEGVLHLENVSCPIRKDCPFCGIVCHPQLYGMTKREQKILKMRAEGQTYKEIEKETGASQSSIKNAIQNVTHKLKLCSSKDLMKIAAAML